MLGNSGKENTSYCNIIGYMCVCVGFGVRQGLKLSQFSLEAKYGQRRTPVKAVPLRYRARHRLDKFP